MSKFKKPIIYILCFFFLLSSVLIPYQNAKAAEAVVVGGLAAAGVALLGLGAIAGVGMELDNNRRFNELSDEEKQRIENGLATDFNDIALQRGASVEHIKQWTTDLCNGVLDKTSECWGIFKDWIKNIHLSDNEWLENNVNGSTVNSSVLNGKSFLLSNGNTLTISEWVTSQINPSNCIGYIVCQYSDYIEILAVIDNSNSIINKTNQIATWKYSGALEYRGGDAHLADYQLPRIKLSMCSKPIIINGIDYNGLGLTKDIFSTNTDYLEKLKGQDEDVIDVIDVTDIKNPIVESRPNSLANINWNRGTRRTNNNNNDDDDNKMVTGLVPMDVWYEQIDDEQEQMQNAVVLYNNYIQEHPEAQGSYFISTEPVTNINNYFNTLPVVNLPAQGTVVNNYYEYNNYNNNNTTIYELPYNSALVPMLPTMIFENKFPFCIPWDIYNFVSAFYVEKEAPKIDIPFPIKGANGLDVETVTIDLSGYEYLSTIIRVMFFVLFLVGLMILTRQLIKG